MYLSRWHVSQRKELFNEGIESPMLQECRGGNQWFRPEPWELMASDSMRPVLPRRKSPW